jgi:sulfotransferase
VGTVNQFVGLSGLPRSGSTLLSVILHQNPKIHAEGNSAVCQLMWDMEQSCLFNSNEQLLANYRFETQFDLISSIPSIYYNNVDREIVIDKCRSWTLESNVQLMKKYITDNPKIIVMVRPINDIISSFRNLYKKNDLVFDEKQLLIKGSEPLMRSIDGLEYAEKSNTGEFLFVNYDDLVDNTKTEIEKIYSFLEIQSFEHDFNNLINLMHEDDSVYGLDGMHDVRKTVCRNPIG